MSKLEETKWHAFESLYKNHDCLKTSNHQRSYLEKPILSEDAKEDIENKLLDFFYSGEKLTLIFYKAGHFYQKKGTITKLAPPKIFFKDQTFLYFNQIMKIF